MPAPTDQSTMLSHLAPPPVKKKKIPTPHLGFLFSLLCPGWGEYHAGAKLAGAITLAAFLSFMVWFSVAFTLSAMSFMDAVIGQIADPVASQSQPQLPLAQLGISFILMIMTWLFSMFHGTNLGLAARDKAGAPEQASQVWAVCMSWACPGAGQVYGRAAMPLALAFFAANITSLVIGLVTLGRFSNTMNTLVLQNPTLTLASLLAMLKTFLLIANYDLIRVLGSVIKLTALIHAVSLVGLLRENLGKTTAGYFTRPDDKWLWAMGAGGVGWLCPGCGQVLQGRRGFGFALLAVYIGAKLAISLMYMARPIDPHTLSRLDLIPTFILWAALLEAVVWGFTRKASERDEQDTETTQK